MTKVIPNSVTVSLTIRWQNCEPTASHNASKQCYRSHIRKCVCIVTTKEKHTLIIQED